MDKNQIEELKEHRLEKCFRVRCRNKTYSLYGAPTETCVEWIACCKKHAIEFEKELDTDENLFDGFIKIT